MGYVRGARRSSAVVKVVTAGPREEIPEEKPKRPRKMTQFEPSACGTYAGYRRHQTHNVPACQDCKDAMAAYSRDRYVKRPPRSFDPGACGTWKGWQRHRYHDVPMCAPCQAAAREYQRQYRAARKQAAA